MAEKKGPLVGLKIIELASLGPAPFCGMLLADLGAEVVMIDRPGGAAAAYGFDPKKEILNRGRRSVVLDLKTPEGVEAALSLIEKADGLIEGNRPDVTERLGLGPDVCLARNPRLVYGRMTGWGQTGPMAMHAGHDINYIALAGALDVCGHEGQAPAIPQNFVGDMGGGGMFLAFGMLAAIIEASNSGQGQVVDAAMIDGAALQMTGVLTLEAMGRFTDERGTHMADGGSHFYQTYKTRDGKYLSVGAIEPQFYEAFRHDAGLTDLEFDRQMDRAAWPSLKQKTAARIAEKTRDEWVAMFTPEACTAPVLSIYEVEQNPHHAERQSFVRDAMDVLQPSPGPRFSRTPGAIASPPPERGADTQSVFDDWREAS